MKAAIALDPQKAMLQRPLLKSAVESIARGDFSDGDTARFKPLIDSLYESDYFMLAADFDDFMRAQREVSAAYRDPARWFRSAIINTASMGFFSSDRTISQYDEVIWKSAPWLREDD